MLYYVLCQPSELYAVGGEGKRKVGTRSDRFFCWKVSKGGLVIYKSMDSCDVFFFFFNFEFSKGINFHTLILSECTLFCFCFVAM